MHVWNVRTLLTVVTATAMVSSPGCSDGDGTTASAPDITIQASTLSGMVPLFIDFTVDVGEADPTGVDVVWDFGDGSPTVRGYIAAHTYTTPGTFAVTVVATNSAGSDTAILDIHVTPPAPEPLMLTAVTATPEQGVAPLEVSLGVAITGGVEPFKTQWSLGDGSSSADAAPTHTYNAPGSYTATVTVTDDDGTTAEGSIIVLVTVDDNEFPEAQASATPTEGAAPLDVSFRGASLGGDPPLRYQWDLGTGDTDSTQNPTYTYTTPGSYEAVLTVTDANGDTSTATVPITVTDDTTPSIDLAASPPRGIAPLLVDFTATVTDGNAPLSFAWEFGDGNTSEQEDPSHSYIEAGVYTVTLTVTDNDGDIATDTLTIEVEADTLPEAIASADPTDGQAPLPVNFACNTATGNTPFTFTWDFGDRSPTVSMANPSHTYHEAGSYEATCTVTDGNGDTSTATVPIT
ncbi:MAG: PKD domain-containing protein, partial [Myxococcota bacterium]